MLKKKKTFGGEIKDGRVKALVRENHFEKVIKQANCGLHVRNLERKLLEHSMLTVLYQS